MLYFYKYDNSKVIMSSYHSVEQNLPIKAANIISNIFG